MKNLSSRLHLLFLTVVLAYALSACNTMEGLGEDVQSAGDTLEDTAQKNK